MEIQTWAYIIGILMGGSIGFINGHRIGYKKGSKELPKQ